MIVPTVVDIELDCMERELTPFWNAMDMGWEPDSQDEVYYQHAFRMSKAFYRLCDISISREMRDTAKSGKQFSPRTFFDETGIWFEDDV